MDRKTPRNLLGAAAASLLVVAVMASSGSAAEPAAAAAIPHFVSETAKSGIKHVYADAHERLVGGGVAAFDCDGDGKPELYFAGGSGPAALYHNDSRVGGPLRIQPALGRSHRSRST